MEVPASIDEATLRAVIQAAAQASRVEVHGLTVSAPPGSHGKEGPSTAEEVEEEDESSDTDDEEKPKKGAKRPAGDVSQDTAKAAPSTKKARKPEVKIGCKRCRQHVGGCFSSCPLFNKA